MQVYINGGKVHKKGRAVIAHKREILRCGLKFTTPRLVYASLVASERMLRMTARGCIILSVAKECSIPVQKDRTILARGMVYSKRKMRYSLRRSKNVCFS